MKTRIIPYFPCCFNHTGEYVSLALEHKVSEMQAVQFDLLCKQLQDGILTMLYS